MTSRGRNSPGRHRPHRHEEPARRRLSIRAPASFGFERAVLSHGWSDLPPFRWDAAGHALTVALKLPDAGPVSVRVSFSGDRTGREPSLEISLAAFRDVTGADWASARSQISRILGLDEDLEPFYSLARQVERPDPRWAEEACAGRLLRSATPFEDLVKMLRTTNCTWALTRVMVRSLVENLGEEAPDGLRLFPSAEAMAGKTTPQRRRCRTLCPRLPATASSTLSDPSDAAGSKGATMLRRGRHPLPATRRSPDRLQPAPDAGAPAPSRHRFV